MDISTVDLLFVCVLFLAGVVFFLSRQNKIGNKAKSDLHKVIVAMQSTESIETSSDYQDRSFVTKLKGLTIHSDMDNSSYFTINESK